MAMRSPAGFISAFFDPLKNPNAPTSPVATGGDTSASVAFTAPANVGGSAITAYYAVANDGTTSSAASSPVTVSGLTNGTSYTFNVWALNSYGPGPWSVTTNSVTPAVVTKGLIAGAYTNAIQYVNIDSFSNTTSFGSLTTARGGSVGLFNTTRMVISAGLNDVCTMDYITISTTGNATVFGNQANPTNNGTSGCSSPTRGVIAGGSRSSGRWSGMTYITTATTGNDTTFGNLTTNLDNINQGCSDGTRGIVGVGGYTGSAVSQLIQYITIASTGNSTSFGNTNTGGFIMGVCGSDTRGLILKAGPNSSSIGYITIASTGDTTNFGDIGFATGDAFGFSNKTRGIFSTAGVSTLNYVTIASLGNGASFGTRDTAAMSGGQVACGSGSQGGL
jgi:hypothetical protein